ncbi:MAG: hypothetical protein FJ145_00850 [Deltaproteobacteria bacterium]|nr:hypothetical protein [Deltaproteobacteria bacterium]
MQLLDEPLESLRQLLQDARQKVEQPFELILIGGAAALLSHAFERITQDFDILASANTFASLQRAGALKFPIQPVADSFLCLHPDYRRTCKYVRELSFPPQIRVYRLSPLDLAISKLSRFQQVDVEDKGRKNQQNNFTSTARNRASVLYQPAEHRLQSAFADSQVLWRKFRSEEGFAETTR